MRSEQLHVFESLWEKTVADAKVVLDISSDDILTNETTVIGSALQEARSAYSSGEEVGVALLAQIHKIVRNLEYVKDRRPDSFARYRARILGGTNDPGAILGEKAELGLECMLLDLSVSYGIRLPDTLNGDEWEVALHNSVRSTHFDYIFAFWEVHVLGYDRSGIQGRFMPNVAIDPTAEFLMLFIEREFRKRYSGDAPRGFFSPDL